MIGGVELGRLIGLDEARRVATARGWREEVLAYVTRHPGEILVLEHSREYAEAGVQVPAGGIDQGEELEGAIDRLTVSAWLFEKPGGARIDIMRIISAYLERGGVANSGDPASEAACRV